MKAPEDLKALIKSIHGSDRVGDAQSTKLNEIYADLDALYAKIDGLQKLINTPEFYDFAKALPLEAAHQIEKWGNDSDAGKTCLDWFWLIGYLAQKVVFNDMAGDREKALHHCITTAAACANWHRALMGKTDMRPGIHTVDEVLTAVRAGIPLEDAHQFLCMAGDPVISDALKLHVTAALGGQLETEYTPTEWPEGAEWWAVDADQRSWFYEDEPTIGHSQWLIDDGKVICGSNINYEPGTIKDWKTSKRSKSQQTDAAIPVDDGWIEWRGDDECPVPDYAEVWIRHRNGYESRMRAGNIEWSKVDPYEDSDGDIIAYRVVKAGDA